MSTINIHEAKTHFSKLVETVAAGSEILIAKAGKPIAKLSPLSTRSVRFGVLKGKVRIAEDFDAALPAEVLALFEAK